MAVKSKAVHRVSLVKPQQKKAGAVPPTAFFNVLRYHGKDFFWKYVACSCYKCRKRVFRLFLKPGYSVALISLNDSIKLRLPLVLCVKNRNARRLLVFVVCYEI